MKLTPPWMSRADRRRWSSARTVADLGELMALWLEGAIASRPGYAANHGPEEETAHLVPTLAALCRAGMITTNSQPGLSGTGANGLWWEQRAAVECVVTDPDLLERLVAVTHDAGMLVRVNEPGGTGEDPVVVTTCDGEPTAWFGGRIGDADMAVQWEGLDPQLFRAISTGTYVSVIAPDYGGEGEGLWVGLDFFTGLRRYDPADPWFHQPIRYSSPVTTAEEN
ncbi:hypothetical protein [Streptomyces sp. NPDC053720]|uniref:DUF6919 domain-containing protein n=1 Tax=Streptomyces sp. NPDC053720 TaxID=3154855 RepID=UPI0034282042